jgi:hypothetical protein
MRVQCPHCQSTIDIAGAPPREVLCPSCGSSISLFPFRLNQRSFSLGSRPAGRSRQRVEAAAEVVGAEDDRHPIGHRLHRLVRPCVQDAAGSALAPPGPKASRVDFHLFQQAEKARKSTGLQDRLRPVRLPTEILTLASLQFGGQVAVARFFGNKLTLAA